MRGRNPKYIPVHRGDVVGVIEHKEIGKLLFAKLSWHIVQCEKAVRHAREGEKIPGLVPHYNVQSEVVARQGQTSGSRVPDRSGKRTTKRRPDFVAELFPADEQKAGVRPVRRLAARNPNSREQVIAIVDSGVGGDD